MGGIRSFKRARGIPNPIGNPALIFNLYTFGQMKPIPSIPQTITIGLLAQSYLNVFIPRNSMSIPKRIVVQALVTIQIVNPNQPGGPNYQESYGTNGAGASPRGGLFNVAPVPQSCTFVIDREFYFDGVTILEYNWDGTPPTQSVSQPDNTSHLVALPHPAGIIDPTVDNYMNFQISTSFAGSADTVTCGWAQAFIQSPLDLRRLTP